MQEAKSTIKLEGLYGSNMYLTFDLKQKDVSISIDTHSAMFNKDELYNMFRFLYYGLYPERIANGQQPINLNQPMR